MEVVLLYFSASWCGACADFTPRLLETYRALRKAGRSFEVVWASQERDEAGFSRVLANLPWPALPFKNKARNEWLKQQFSVSSIPALVVLDRDGSVLTSDGAKALLEDPTAAHFPWGATVGTTAGHAPKSELSTEQMIARAKQLAAELGDEGMVQEVRRISHQVEGLLGDTCVQQLEDRWLRRSFQLADEARRSGDRPFGALLVDGLAGAVLFEAKDTVISAADPLAHAEMNVLRLAVSANLQEMQLARCVVVSSAEPCSMCTAAMEAMGISICVFGLASTTLRSLHAKWGEGRKSLQMIGPSLQDEGSMVHQGYW